MPALQLVADQPLSGKSALATGIAQGLARDGARVRLVRIGSGDAAEQDAQTFASYYFAASSGLTESTLPSPAENEYVIAELDAGATSLPRVPAIIAVRGAPGDAATALASSLGDQLIGSIAVTVAPGSIEPVARDMTNAGLRPLTLVPEDRVLAAPSVGEIAAALDARVLYAGDNELETVEDILIAPIYSDPARPHFHRYASKAILAPFNKTDLHLAALESGAACIIITGGKGPSPYVLDRAQHEPTTILLSQHDTPGTIAALADVWSTSRFRGEQKAAAILAHLDGRVDFASLVRKLQPA